MPAKKPKARAVLTIRNAKEMDEKRREDIADWLRNRADELVAIGDQYSRKFTARYLYGEEEECDGSAEVD